MKHSYLQSGIFHAFQTLGIFLTSLTLLTSCSNELEGFSIEKEEEANSNIASSKEDSVLRFLTIDELENISVSDIPGDHDGFELKELSYQCVDTIELRALRFDVTAKLHSSSKHEKVIMFSAEVGPELVSVEYYPGGEMIPAHHNLATAFYPKVERYRNYSDGSRIGPDEFYDYGHGLGFNIFTQDVLSTSPSITKYEMSSLPTWIGYNINPDCFFYKEGAYYFRQKGIVEHNLNTVLIEENGSTFSGEDFYFIHPIEKIYDDAYIRDQSSQMLGDFYSTSYIPSFTYGEEYDELLHSCSQVPDISPTPFPKDTKSLTPGWYFGMFSDYHVHGNFLFSKNALSMDQFYFNKGISIDLNVWGYLQYLVIDNRIIHFEDIALNNYSGICNIKPIMNMTKSDDGYYVKYEAETQLYGDKLKSIFEIDMKGIDGPYEVIDNSSYSSIENADTNELGNLNQQNEETRSASSSNRIIRADGKRISIDRSLPQSLRSIKNTRTISSFDK